MEKEITDYFRSNIFEARAAYFGWKVLSGSRSTGIVSKEMVERYVEIQSYHSTFFTLAERAFLVQFVLLSLHAFDSDSRSFSLYKVDETKTREFMLANKTTLDMLFDLRNKLFAHKDGITNNEYKIPSLDSLDKFFLNLMEFYNVLTSSVDGSHTIFSNTEEIKHDLEHMFMNLYRGHHARKKEIDIDYLWLKNNGKISDKV